LDYVPDASQVLVVEFVLAELFSELNWYETDLQMSQADMEAAMAQPVPEGEQPRSDVAIVAEVLTKQRKSSTFLKNVGLQQPLKNKFKKSNEAVTAQVLDLEERLGRSQGQTQEMREEMAAIKKKAEEAEAAQAQRDKEYQALLKRTEESEARYAHLMSLLGDKVVLEMAACCW
jgi:Skp family chaperone for outer membrane proteins